MPTVNRYEQKEAIWPPEYPFMFINLGGGLLETGPSTFTGWHDTTHWSWNSRNFWFEEGTQQAGTHAGSAVIFEPGKYMRCGGGLPGGQASAVTAVLIVAEKRPPFWWRRADDMTYGRRHHDLVLLPNKTVLAVGGAIAGHTVGSGERRVAEIFDPEDTSKNIHGSWTADPANVTMEQPRGYHSASLLLPDARVLVAGGEDGDPEPIPGGTIPLHPWTAQIYRPPYLDGDPPRAFLDDVPERLVYDRLHTIKVTMDREFEWTRVCLIKLGAVTSLAAMLLQGAHHRARGRPCGSPAGSG